MAVRVVALDAVHHPFDDGMMLRELEFGVDVQVALKAGGGILAGIDDEATATATDAHMFAGGAVARFTAANGCELDVVLAEAAMGAGGERAGNVRVAIDAGGVADVMRAFNTGRSVDGFLERRAGGKETG